MPRYKNERKNVNTQYKSICLKNLPTDLYNGLNNISKIRGCSMTHLILEGTRLHLKNLAIEIVEEKGLQDLIKESGEITI